MKRFIHILSVFCLFALFFQTAQAQTVNRKLYLKSGNLMDRTAPTGSTPIISSAFSKTGVIIDLVGSATTGSQAVLYTGLSRSHLTTSDPDRLMIVSIASDVALSTRPKIDSVKYGTQKLILLDSARIDGVKIEVWYLLNPNNGTATVQPYWVSNLEASMGVVTFRNVDQENPILSYKLKTSTTTPNNFFVNSNFGDFIIDAIATTANNSNQPTILTGGTEYVRRGSNSVSVVGSTRNGGADSTEVGYSGTIDNSALIAITLSGNSNSETFKLKPALCNPAVIKAGKEIEIKTFVNNLTLTAGSTLNSTPPFRAVVTNKNNTELFSINKPTWDSGTNTFIWRKTLSSDITIPAGDSLHFTVINDTTNVSFTLSYGSSGSASYVYLPFADIAVHDSTRVFSATGASGFIKKVAATGTTVYVRDTVRMPLGIYSLNNYQLEIKQGGTASGTIISSLTPIASSDCQRVYEYAWTPSSPGDYYIISRIGEGSDSTTHSLDTTIFSVCSPTLTPTLVNPGTGLSNGRIELLLSNSIGDYTYNWAGQSSGSGTGNAITGLAAGTYNVTVNSVNGCQVTSSGLTLTSFTPPALTFIGKITNNCSGGTGSQGAVEIVVTSANAGPYTYAWTPSANTRTITGLANGTYTVTVTDNYSQTVIAPFTVATSSAINITESTTNETCALNDGKIDISVTGGLGSSYSYKWSNGYSIEDIDKIPEGAYTVTVTDAAGCTNVLSKTVTLTCNRKPLANDDSFSALKGATTITGNLATNDSDPDGNSLTYAAIDNPNASTQGTINITSSGGITFTPVSAFVGLLKLRYEITDNGVGALTDTAIVSLSIYEPGTDTICVSAGTARFAIDADPMYTTYAWTIPQGTSIVGSSTTNAITLNVASATPDTLGDVCVTVGNICGETSQKCYPVFLKKNTPIITAPAVCEGNDVSLTVSQNTTYSWTGPNSFTSNVRNPFLYNVPSSFNGGEYKVTTTDAFGCVGRDSILLQVNSNPTLTAVLTDANCGGSNGAIDITVTNGVTPTYRWSTGAIVEDLTTITYGNYGVTVTNSTGCTADTMFSIKDIQGPSVALTKTNVLCAQGVSGAIAIVSPYDDATYYSFSWTNGSTANALSALSIGDYGVVVTDKATGCHGTANVLITEPDKLTLESTQTNVACAGNTGAITTLGKGGTGSYTYAWSSGPTTASLSSIAAGTYTVTLTDANSCTVVQSFTITAPSTLAATASAVDVSCNLGTNGKVNLSVTGGTTPYRYLWSNGGTTQNIQGLTAATYTVTVTDASNCSVIVSQAVTQLPALAISENITAVLCNSGNNGAINITAAGGRTPYTYAWSNGVTTEDLTNLTAQAYVVTLTDANGCTFPKSITVTQPAAPLAVTNVPMNVSCFGAATGEINISVTGGTSPYVYKWNPAQVTFFTNEDTTGLAAGTYSVIVKDANNCEATSGSINITQQPAIVVNATLALDSCGTGTKGKIDLTVSGGRTPYVYAWTKNGDGFTASTEDISSLAAGTYNLVLKDNNNSSPCTFSQSFVITAPTSLAISSLGPTNLNCFGSNDGSFTPSISGGITPYTYLWSTGATTRNISNLAAGAYTLTVTDAYNCPQSMGPVTLTEPVALSISNAALTQVNCNGGNNGAIDLTIAGGTPLSGNYVYIWSNGQTTQDLTGLKKGTYYVTVSDNNNCSVVGGPYSITDPSGFNITSTVQNVTCAGGTNGSINLAVTGSSGSYAYLLNGNAASLPFNNLDSGNYVIRVADASVLTCFTELTVNVSQPDSIKATKFIQNISCNGINDGSISLLPSGGSGGTYTYAWSNSAGNTFAITSLAPGKYVFTVTDANACQIKDSVTLTGPSPLVVSGTKSDVLCFGQSNGSITLTNPSGGISPYGYFWSNGASTQNLSSLATGFYSVTVTDANNCKDTLDFQVTQPAAPLTADIAATPAGCLTNDGKLVGVGLGGTAPYTYLWSNSLGTTQGIANVPLGNYSATITDANGCTTVATDSIILVCEINFDIPDPDVNITYVNVLINGSVATNDDVQVGTTYGNPTAKSTNPPGGVLVLQSDGNYTFTSPNPGTYYYDVEVCAPGQSSSCPKTLLKIEVLPLDPDVKLPPIANHDVAYTSLNTPVTLKTFNNDRAMQPGATLTDSTVNSVAGFGPTNGTIAINSSGDITFTPTTGFTGIETYYYKVCDSQTPSLCDTATQTIYVLPTTPPNSTQASDDYNSTLCGVAVTGNVKDNDYDLEGHTTLVTALDSTITGKGRLVLLTNGSYTFTPNLGFYGPVSYPYTICDDQTPKACAKATLYILVKQVIPAAGVASSTPTLCINTALTASITHTTTGATGIGIPIGLPAGVTAAWAPNTITISGTPTVAGTFNYSIPLTGGCGTVNATGTITVTLETMCIPDPDVNITYVNVLINGSVATNDDVPPGTTYGTPVPTVTNPPLGVLTLNPDGTYTFTSPNPGTYYYEVDVCPAGITSGCPKTLLKIEVLPLDPSAKLPPIANHDIAYTLLNSPVVLLTFNNDAALEPGKILNPASLDTIAGLGSRNGTVTFNRTTGDITFTPKVGFTGIETYYYRVCDNQSSALCDTAIQTIYVLPNTPPNSTQAADDYKTSFSGVTVTGSVKANDIDPEGHPTSVTAQTTTLTGKGTFVLLTDGTYTFTPVPGFFGPVSFPYTICDNQNPAACAMATLYILIKPFFPDPDVNITYLNVPVTGSVSTNDDAPLGTTYKNPVPKNTNPPGATLVLQPDGTYTFRSENPGVYYYEIEVCAPGQTTGCTTRTLKITVLQVGEFEVNPPIAQIDIAYTLKNAPVVLKTTANDTTGMTGRSLNRASITLVTLPANGVSLVNTTTGDVTYTPNNNFVGIERYTYRICDNGTTPLCDTAIQEIYIFDATIPNSTQAADDYYTTFGGTKVSGSVISNDNDPQGHPTTVTPLTSDIAGIGKLVLLANGSFEFEPDGNFSGPVSFVYEICDNQSPKACAKATLYILVKPIPKPAPDYNLTYVKIKIEETDADVSTNDILPSTFMALYTLKAAIPGNPSNALPIFNVNKRGTYTFVTDVKGLYEYDVYVCPSSITTPNDLCLQSRLTINVLDFESPLNPPTALPDFATTKKNVPVTLESLVNDAPGNSGGLLDPFSVKIISNGRFGSGKVDEGTGNIIYMPLRNYVGYDTLTYQVCELNEPTLCDTTYQIIEIEPVSDPNFVQATDDYVNTFANRPVSGNVITNDSDPEGHSLSVTPVTYIWPGGNKGTLVLNADGSFVFTPVKSFYGLLSFKYNLCDNGTPQACAEATLFILVKPISLPSPDINATFVNKNLFGDVSTNDRFIPGTSYRVLNALPSNPSATLPNMNNKGYYTFLSYVPGTFIYNVELCPPFASGFGCELTQLKIDVLQVADTASNRPVAHTDIAMTMFNTPVTILTLINDKSGLENGKLDSANVTIVIQPDSGIVSSISALGNITYAPNATFFGNDTITYKICELNKPTLCATAIQVITVLEDNAANNTSAADDYFTTKAGVPVSGQILMNDLDPEGHGKGVADNSLRTPITLADQLSWRVSLRSVLLILDTTVASVGRFRISNDGTFNFIPEPTFFGPYNLPYQQCDAGTPVACARASIYILVDPPVTVPSGGVSCISDVNITLNQTCQNFVTADMVLLGSVGTDLKVRINDLNPTNGAVLDGVSPVTVGWIYSVFKANGDFVCSGRIHATDKSAPEVTKPNDVNLICDAVNKVQDVPASWLNTSYQFFTGSPTNVYDNCGGPLSLKVTDVLSYTNCGVDNIYATINRSFRYTDKYGNDSVVIQKINFRRPINSTFVGTPVSQVRLGNFGPLGANTKYTTINGQVDQNAKPGAAYIRDRRDTLVFNSCGAPTTSAEIRAYLRDAYKYVYLIDTSTYRRDTAYLFDDLCNYQVSFTYNTFPKCNSGSHIQAVVSIMDGCTNTILVDTLSLIFQDTIAPQFLANSTQLNGIRGSLENAPVQINASIQSCSGSIRLPSNAGMNGWILSSHFNVKVSDNCNASQVSFSYKLETKNHWNGYYVPRSTWVEDGYVAMPMPDQSIVYNNLPIGEHRLIVSAFDQCANTGLDTFYFNLVDNTPPVMACKDKLNVSITSNSSDNWYLNGRYAKSLYPGEGEKSAGRVYVSDINDGSRDNCRLDSLYVRRMFTTDCLDFLKLNMIYDQFGLNPNGLVDIADFEPVAGKPDTYWTPRGMPYIEIFCCDLSAGNKEIMVELWGRDGGALPFASSQSAWSYCWSVINIEDKSAPVITKVDYTVSGNAGKKNWIYCTDKEAIKAVQQEDLSVLRFGFPSIFGLECNGKVTYSSKEKLHCDTGLIYRTWVVEKEIKPGMVVTVSYTDSIFVLAHHKYTITVPADVVTDCADQGGQSIPGVTFDETGCDLLAISMSPDRIYDRDVKGDQCKTIYRTSTVINWCQVPNQFQCSNAVDPMLFATVLPRNTSSIAQVYQFEKKMISPPAVISNFVNGPMIVNALGSTTNIFNALLKLNPGCAGTLGEQSFAWQYTQIILVKDTVAPVIGADYIAPDFGVSSQNQCLAAGKIAFKVTDNCTSSPLLLDKAVVYEKNGQVAVGKVNTTLPLSFTGAMEVSVSDLTAGVSAAKQYELLVTVRDGCGVSSSKRLPFSVSVKAAPAIVCVQTLTTSLMKTDDNQAMQRIRAIDFFQDITRDWSAGACSPVVAVGISRDMNASFSADSSVVVTCNDLGVIPVKVFLKDAYGNVSFCSTFIEVEDNANLCPASNILNSDIAGVIRTVNKLPIPKVSMKLAGHKDRELSTNDKGIYVFGGLPNGYDYTVKPTLDKDHLNGVSTFDLILITKHILGLRPLESPYQLIAADINRSGSISTLDLIQLRKLILNVTDRFPDNTSWRFIREGYIFPNLGNLWTNNFPEIFNLNNLKSNSYGNFVGIKIGDVSGNVNPSGAQTSIIRREEKAVPLNVVVKPMENGQYQCTFFIPEAEMPDGFQFTLQWAKGLTLVEILPDLLESQNIGQFSEENMLTFSWNGDKKSGKLFTLIFDSSNDYWNKENFLLSNRLTPTEAYKGESVVPIKLYYPVITDIHAAALLQNYPNPFQQETFVPFYIPENGEVIIEITNVNAGIVKYSKGEYTKGFHHLRVDKNELKVAGVYMVSMKYNNQLFHNKIMFIND